MEYPKINSLWKRQGWYFNEAKKKSKDHQEGRQSFIVGDYARSEFSNIRNWSVQEKVDGTNIRIYYDKYPLVYFRDGDEVVEEFGRRVNFHGRTSNAQLPCHLLEYLQTHFTAERIESAFYKDVSKVVLYGEGYGPKIQSCGGNYRKDPGFCLFDVRVGDWWLERLAVEDIAKKLEIPFAPELGFMQEHEIVEFVKSNPLSQCSSIPQRMEGIIARSFPLMLFRNGDPVMFKLKCRDFDGSVS
jgi:hypothetical protein